MVVKAIARCCAYDRVPSTGGPFDGQPPPNPTKLRGLDWVGPFLGVQLRMGVYRRIIMGVSEEALGGVLGVSE